MSGTPARPLFLARRSYRLRRLADAARLLPVLGAGLFLLPALWTPAPGAASATAHDAVYLFAVWLLLILAAFALARGLAPTLDETPAAAEPEAEPGPVQRPDLRPDPRPVPEAGR